MNRAFQKSLWACSFSAFWAAMGAPSAQAAARPLRIVVGDFPPYVYEEGGRAAGVDVDLLQRILGRLGLEAEFKVYPWPRAWLMVEKGTADIILDVSFKDSRESLLHYTDGQRSAFLNGGLPQDHLWLADYVLFTTAKQRDAPAFESYSQLTERGYRIGTNKGYSYSPDFLAAGLDTVEVVEPRRSFEELLAGTFDFYAFERSVGLSVLRKMGLTDQVRLLPGVLFTKPYFVCGSKRSSYPELRTVMDDIYREIRKSRRSGEFRELHAAHVPNPLPAPAGRKLRFVCEDWEPFEYVGATGQLLGLDVEVIDVIMKRLRVPYEIEIYPWTRAWMMAEKGAADAVLSVSYKATRESVLYYTHDQRRSAETGKLPVDYLWLSEYVFFVKTARRGQMAFESFEQLKRDNVMLGVNKGYTYCPDFVPEKHRTTVYFKTEDGFRGLLNGDIDLYPMDRTVGLTVLRRMGVRESVTFLPKPLFAKPYLAPFVKTSDYPDLEAVMYAFNRELRGLRASGYYDELYRGHVGPDD